MNKLKLISIAVMALAVSACGQPAGVAQPIINTVQNTSLVAKENTVMMFFWYGCPHCYHLHKEMKAFNKDGVKVEMIAVPGNPLWTKHAQHFYAMKQMGLLEQLSDKFFDMVQSAGSNPSDAEIDRFFASNGVDVNNYHKVYRSESVSVALKDARDLAARYSVRGVPSLFVDGDRKVEMDKAKSFSDIPTALTEYYNKKQ